jgi:hypothetical protein
LLSSLRTLLGLLCTRKRSLSLKAQPLSFALLSLPLLLRSEKPEENRRSEVLPDDLAEDKTDSAT